MNRGILDLLSTFRGSHLRMKHVAWISSSKHVTWSIFSTSFQQSMKSDYSSDFILKDKESN